jgi:hypothetical protein
MVAYPAVTLLQTSSTEIQLQFSVRLFYLTCGASEKWGTHFIHRESEELVLDSI